MNVTLPLAFAACRVGAHAAGVRQHAPSLASALKVAVCGGTPELYSFRQRYVLVPGLVVPPARLAQLVMPAVLCGEHGQLVMPWRS